MSSLLACQVIVGVNDEAGERLPPLEDAGGDAADDADGGMTDPCVKRHPPPAPALTTENDGEGSKFLAVRRFVVRPRSNPTLGYDLDDRCTDTPGSTTTESPCTHPPSEEFRDDDAGIDNIFGHLIKPFASNPSVDDALAAPFNISADRGLFTLLIEIRDWNGTPNDGRVYVALITTASLAETNGCDAGPRLTPGWDGCDVWNHAPGHDFFELGAEKYSVVAIDGYVADGVLVAQDTNPAIERPFGLSSARAVLHHALVTGNIGLDEAGHVTLTNGILAGRIPPDSLITFATHLDVDGGPLCRIANAPELVRAGVCELRDIPLSKADEGKGKACDALSFAIGFDATQAKLGVVEVDAALGECGQIDTTCPP